MKFLYQFQFQLDDHMLLLCHTYLFTPITSTYFIVFKLYIPTNSTNMSKHFADCIDEDQSDSDLSWLFESSSDDDGIEMEIDDLLSIKCKLTFYIHLFDPQYILNGFVHWYTTAKILYLITKTKLYLLLASRN